MSVENYFQLNLETGKLNIHTPKEYYQSLRAPMKQLFSRYCYRDRTLRCWVSKEMADKCYFLKQNLLRLGFLEQGPVGRKPTYEEKVSKDQNHLVKCKDPVYVEGKIKTIQKHILACERRLNGKFFFGFPPEPVTQEQRTLYQSKLEEEKEKLDYYQKCMKAIHPDWKPREKTLRVRSKGKKL
ncbi:hypothetical protein [Chitinophaga defluvii]|uniref:Uncharacterized protein n=1 Tax=Chitinophaga defluvii TaxID=3163343 RepID=A0ABV2TCE9_9BACT